MRAVDTTAVPPRLHTVITQEVAPNESQNDDPKVVGLNPAPATMNDEGVSGRCSRYGHAAGRRPLPPCPRQALQAHGQARAGAGAVCVSEKSEPLRMDRHVAEE